MAQTTTIKVKSTTEEIVEIEYPIFFKNKYENYYAYFDEKTTAHVIGKMTVTNFIPYTIEEIYNDSENTIIDLSEFMVNFNHAKFEIQDVIKTTEGHARLNYDNSNDINAMKHFNSSEFEPTAKDKFEKHEDLKKEVIN